jgi:hypothetical protein
MLHKNAIKSQIRLMELQYDPIEKLVLLEKKLQEELSIHEKIRDSSKVFLDPKGKPRNYNPQAHQMVLDKLLSVSDKLMRYMYARVPETLELKEESPRRLIVQLTGDNEEYVLEENTNEFNGVIDCVDESVTND